MNNVLLIILHIVSDKLKYIFFLYVVKINFQYTIIGGQKGGNDFKAILSLYCVVTFRPTGLVKNYFYKDKTIFEIKETAIFRDFRFFALFKEEKGQNENGVTFRYTPFNTLFEIRFLYTAFPDGLCLR